MPLWTSHYSQKGGWNYAYQWRPTRASSCSRDMDINPIRTLGLWKVEFFWEGKGRVEVFTQQSNRERGSKVKFWESTMLRKQTKKWLCKRMRVFEHVRGKQEYYSHLIIKPHLTFCNNLLFLLKYSKIPFCFLKRRYGESNLRHIVWCLLWRVLWLPTLQCLCDAFGLGIIPTATPKVLEDQNIHPIAALLKHTASSQILKRKDMLKLFSTRWDYSLKLNIQHCFMETT